MSQEMHTLIIGDKTYEIKDKVVRDWLSGNTTAATNDAIKVTGITGQEIGLDILNTTTNRHLEFAIGSGGTNGGIYDYNLNKWLIASKSNGSVLVNGYDAVTERTSVTNTNLMTESIYFTKRFGIVQVACFSSLKSGLPAGWSEIGTIPAGFRPEGSDAYAIRSQNLNQLVTFFFYGDGQIRVYNYGAAFSNNGNANFVGCYMAP